MRTISYDTIVVGSGCAGYNALDSLYSFGVKDVALLTEGRSKGTSRNTGSDKQTYYKLSLAGDGGDSVRSMAETLFSYGGVDGPIALCEAASSVRGFMKLCSLGVAFPTNSYGEYVGYQTDHDTRLRATSAGPLTSKYMTEALERKVFDEHLPVIDNCSVIRIVAEGGTLKGLVALLEGEIVYFKCRFVIWCTGGPAGIYRDSVYPESQHGASGIALASGVKGCNLEHWQYGIASTSFRWNLSGSYQQVLPRYVSIDRDGIEHEFLFERELSPDDVLSREFLKGYQWPFDSQKIAASSWIDLALYDEVVRKGRHVFLDYRTNPRALSPDFSNIGKEAYAYLSSSHILFGTPIERLEKLNPLSIALYKSHGIDLASDMLEISVSVQHHNGGLLVDEHWESNIKGFYVAGEAAGTFGAYRPGGTALNSTQVGSMRAAEHIALHERNAEEAMGEAELLAVSEECEKLVHCHDVRDLDCLKLSALWQRHMSENAAFLRNIPRMEALNKELGIVVSGYFAHAYLPKGWGAELYFAVYDQLVTSLAVLGAMISHAKMCGSYGGAVYLDEEGRFLSLEDPHKDSRLITEYDCGSFKNEIVAVRPIPHPDLWFENVWAEYRKRRGGL